MCPLGTFKLARMDTLSHNFSIRTYLAGLIFTCPIENGNPGKCISKPLASKANPSLAFCCAPEPNYKMLSN